MGVLLALVWDSRTIRSCQLLRQPIYRIRQNWTSKKLMTFPILEEQTPKTRLLLAAIDRLILRIKRTKAQLNHVVRWSRVVSIRWIVRKLLLLRSHHPKDLLRLPCRFLKLNSIWCWAHRLLNGLRTHLGIVSIDGWTTSTGHSWFSHSKEWWVISWKIKESAQDRITWWRKPKPTTRVETMVLSVCGSE